MKSRAYEQAIKPAYLEGKQPVFNMANGLIPGEMHLSDGQEPCAAFGVCAHLGPDDTVTATTVRITSRLRKASTCTQ